MINKLKAVFLHALAIVLVTLALLLVIQVVFDKTHHNVSCNNAMDVDCW